LDFKKSALDYVLLTGRSMPSHVGIYGIFTMRHSLIPPPPQVFSALIEGAKYDWGGRGDRLPFWKREKKPCEFCGKNDPTRKVQTDNNEWKLICESCWLEKKIHPYLII